MNLRLVELRSLRPNVCVAEFERLPERTRLRAEFRVEERDGIAVAAPTPDVFREFDGTIEELRQVVAAVIAFCHAAAPNEAEPA